MCKQRERNGNVNMCFQHKLLCSNPTRKKVRGAKGKWIAFVAAPDPKTTFYNFHLADTFYVYKNCVSFHARREVIQVTSAWILKCSGNCFRHSWNLCGWVLKITAWKWLFAVVNMCTSQNMHSPGLYHSAIWVNHSFIYFRFANPTRNVIKNSFSKLTYQFPFRPSVNTHRN